MKKIVLLAFVQVLLLLAIGTVFMAQVKAEPATSGSIIINNDDDYTNSTSVTLNLSAPSGASQMQFSNDNENWTQWEEITTSKAWTITSGDGNKTVYVQYKDNVGQVSSYSDTITLDTTPPTISITSPSDGAEVRSSSPLIVWNGADATSGLNRSEIRLDGGSWIRRCNACTYYTFIDIGDGSHTVEVRAFDKAGNSRVVSVNFTVNTSPVVGPDIILVVVVVIVALVIVIYLLKIRKKKPSASYTAQTRRRLG